MALILRTASQIAAGQVRESGAIEALELSQPLIPEFIPEPERHEVVGCVAAWERLHKRHELALTALRVIASKKEGA